MVYNVYGDIFNCKEDIIGHQTNCRGRMGSGIAKEIRARYPSAYYKYVEHCKVCKYDSALLLGSMLIVPTGHGNHHIANLFGQNYYGTDKPYTEEWALESALKQLKLCARQAKLSIALPYHIGCGRAGGNWNNIYAIIEHIFNDYNVTIYNNEDQI